MLPVQSISANRDGLGLPVLRQLLECSVFMAGVDIENPADLRRAQSLYTTLLGRDIEVTLLRSILKGNSDPNVTKTYGIPALSRVPLDLWIRFMQASRRQAERSA
ncbi:MAG: hypothetical protein HQL11_05465 [Candidatus Omnitrophica bacterium]|nr:hypothetical protein [Candidatus Omnitrophota bacterium]